MSLFNYLRWIWRTLNFCLAQPSWLIHSSYSRCKSIRKGEELEKQQLFLDADNSKKSYYRKSPMSMECWIRFSKLKKFITILAFCSEGYRSDHCTTLHSIKARLFFPESSNDASDRSDDRRRLQVCRRLVVAAGHQAAQVQGGEQRRRHQGEKRHVFLNEVAS